jgi:hypothetical protein
VSITPKSWGEFQHYKNRAPIWIKLHRKLLDNYEFSRLPVASRALAPILWLLASEYDDGKITATNEEIAFRLRMPEAELVEALNPLISAEFFTSDSKSLARRKRVAIPERETETQVKTEIEKNSEANASGADAPDIRTKLFNESLKTLARITGKTPDSCRGQVGKWLKAVNDEAIHVVAAIEDAERNRIADPVAWITRVLQPRTTHGQATKPQNGLSAALRDLRRSNEAEAIREVEGFDPPRLLSHG